MPIRPRHSPVLIEQHGAHLAVLICRYPAFWPKDASFLATMEEFHEQVRAKSPELKRG